MHVVDHCLVAPLQDNDFVRSTLAVPGRSLSSGPNLWRQRVGAFTALPALIRQLGADPMATLASAGLQHNALDAPENRVPYGALGRLLSGAAECTHCAHLGLIAGRTWRLGDLGLVGELTRHSASVGEALRTLTMYQHLNSAGGLAFLLEHGHTVDFGYAIYYPDAVGADQIYDAALAACFNYLRELCGPEWTPSEVLLAHKNPLDREPYRRLFKVQPRFNAEYSALRFSATWLDRKTEGSDPARRRLALQLANQTDRGLLIDQVFRALRVLLLHGKHSGDEVADMLAMHRRTLNRRLKAEGTTFQQLLDEVRFAVARQLLSDSEITLDDVAATLGYAGVSPFMRTFRRWAGTTPGRWRSAGAPDLPPDGKSRAMKAGMGKLVHGRTRQPVHQAPAP